MSDASTTPQFPQGDAVLSVGKLRDAIIANVDVTVDAHIGGGSMTVSSLQNLSRGSVVRLEASLNDLVDLRVNGLSVARGELVSVGDQFAVRIISLAP